jgi:hypothetical protein
MDLASLKTARSQAKRRLTLKLNATKVLLAEDEIDEINKNDLVEKYKTFVKKHEEYSVVALNENAETEDDLDKYLEAQQVEYTSVMKEFRDAVKTNTIQPIKQDSSGSNPSVDLSREELLGVLSINSQDYLKPYDGNPMSYHVFVMSFDQTVNKIADPHHKLNHLLRFTTGDAYHAIEGCAIIGGLKGYERARKILESRFGDENIISRSIMQHLMKGSAIRSNSDLQKLADDLVTADLTFDSMKHSYDSQELILKIVARLNKYHNDRWRKYALDYRVDKGDYPKFKAFVKFVQRSAMDANDPVYGYKNEPVPSEKKNRGYSHAASSDKPGNSTCKNHVCPKCKGPHRLYMCELFKNLDVKTRQVFVKDNNLCFNCFLDNHGVANCRSPSRCRTCNRKHNSLLHIFDFSDGSSVSQAPSSVLQNSALNNVASGNDIAHSTCTVSNLNPHANDFTFAHSSVMNNVHQIMLPLVAVTVNDKFLTHALLDPASTHTFVKKNLVDALSRKGTKAKLNLSTMNKNNERITHFFPLKLTSSDGNMFHVPRAYEASDIPVPQVTLDANYSHLSDLPVADPSNVSILIGQDCSECLVPQDVRVGRPGEPYAVRTLLGWCICGPISPECSRNIVGVNMLVTAGEEKDIQALWEIDQEGSSVEEKEMSLDDKQVLQLWENHVKVVDGKFQFPIPWKDGHPNLPNNFPMALKRIQSLINRLKRDRTTV